MESDPDNRYNDAIPVFQFVSSRMEDVLKNASENGAELPLLLQCLHSFVCHVPPDIVRNAHFKRFVCIKLSPNLISFLDIADRNVPINSATANSASADKGEAAAKPSFWKRREREVRLTEANTRTLISVVVEMSRLLGPSAEMRPVLESLFHRTLICSQPRHRDLPMHFVTELFGDAERVLQMAVYAAPETIDDEVGEKMEEDFDAMSLFKLITDCLEESSKKSEHPKLVNESLRCLRQLVFTLDSISNGTGITDELAKRILLKYPTLRDSDYDGRKQ